MKTIDIIKQETRGPNAKWLLATKEIDGRCEGREPKHTLWRAAEVVIARREKAGDYSKTLGIVVRKVDGVDIGYWIGTWDGEKVRKF